MTFILAFLFFRLSSYWLRSMLDVSCFKISIWPCLHVTISLTIFRLTSQLESELTAVSVKQLDHRVSSTTLVLAPLAF